MNVRTDDQIAAELASIVFELMSPGELPRQILTLLAKPESKASSNQLMELTRRRRASVQRACRQLSEAGLIERVSGGRWRRVREGK